MKSIGIILARGGSKRLPKKNIKELDGKPLILYTVEEAKKSNLDRIVVSSDSDEILDVVKKNGVDIIKRPSELASDESPSIKSIKHTLMITEKKHDTSYDKILLLQPTSPERSYKLINKSLEIDADAVVSVQRKNKVEFCLNGAIFLMKRCVVDIITVPHEFLIDDLLDLEINVVCMISDNMVDIDTIHQFNEVERRISG